ncbi:MAG: hypothetical protein OdinLCB4_000820 [Candidatus Odinarchaeum yellowstonii]|uniref:Uncharacterized protein n=1 Tax=Odinarchaeota yellowstonii (strain LCB_4) TaxID=1841599 RepID=A0AAF0D2K3_ODILC|nr:MAG: hypothetical protein OdinLCB4_000820 [Candidatus Odinarchaeum yellowstonii]
MNSIDYNPSKGRDHLLPRIGVSSSKHDSLSSEIFLQTRSERRVGSLGLHSRYFDFSHAY